MAPSRQDKGRRVFALFLCIVILCLSNFIRQGILLDVHLSNLHGRIDNAYDNTGEPGNFLFADAEDSARILLRAAQTPRPIFDEEINESLETERCRRYDFEYGGRKERRRIFWGSLIADDSWHALSAIALETYGLFHSIAFVESNRTQMLYERKLRFGPFSEARKVLESGMFGPDSAVTVDYYVNESSPLRSLGREHAQRSLILERWKKNGMAAGDIGYLSDADETFSRDFFRALQICNVREFDSHENCYHAKISSRSLVFEGSPKCLVKRHCRRPDVIIGECIDTIANYIKHPSVERTWGGIGWLGDGYTKESGFSALPNNATHFPLLNAADFRRISGTVYGDKIHTGYHFHNFLSSFDSVRRKYKTYGHPVHNADVLPLDEIHEHVAKMIHCLQNKSDDTLDFLLKGGIHAITGPVPFALRISTYVDARHAELKEAMQQYLQHTTTQTSSTNATSS